MRPLREVFAAASPLNSFSNMAALKAENMFTIYNSQFFQ